MQPRATPRQDGAFIENEPFCPGDDPHQGGPFGTRATTDARSYGTKPSTRLVAGPRGALLRRRTAPAHDSMTESGWMSIFAPVSLAASRAFWPSLPMASDSW